MSILYIENAIQILFYYFVKNKQTASNSRDGGKDLLMNKIIEAVKTGKEIADGVNEKSGIFMEILNSIPEYRANKLFIENVENDPNLDYTQKMALLYQHKAVKKAAINLNQIYNAADLLLKDKGTSLEEKVPDDDWFGMYNDIAKNISDEEMQVIWSKILASECINSNSISKKLLSILQIIDAKTAKAFSKLCSYSIYIELKIGRKFIFIYPHKLLFADKVQSLENYFSNTISYEDILNLQSLDLITYDCLNQYAYKLSEIDFHYYNATIHVKSSNDNISVGCVMLTNEGNKLAEILYDDMENQKADDKFLEFLIDFFKLYGKCEAEIIK